MVKVTSLLAKGSVLESELGQKWRHGVLKASPIPCCPDKRGVSVIMKGKKNLVTQYKSMLTIQNDSKN